MRTAAVLLAVFMSLALPARADDTGAAQQVIQSQIDAFKRDDAPGAYALASPLIHDLFPTAEIFTDMVRGGYAPVYRHKKFDFGEVSVTPGGTIVQRVGIIDADDIAWEAVYTLEKQDDGTWKISSCVLKKLGAAV